MNVFSATGNLGRDAAANNVNGTAVLNFPLAVKSGFGQNEQTLWLDCALWGKQAEGQLINYLGKGQQVAVSGELGSREYQANDGTTKTVITCRINRVDLCGGGQGQGGSQPQQARQPQQAPQQPQQQPRQMPTQGVSGPAPQQPAGGFDDFDDDIPF